MPFLPVRSLEKLSLAKVREPVHFLLYGTFVILCNDVVIVTHSIMCFLPGPDVQVISKVLENVPDWKGLAGWLSISSHPIETDCAQDVAQASCYRRELVRRYCNGQPSEKPCKVAGDIANALDQMRHILQAQQLRELKFGKSVAKYSSLRECLYELCDSPADRRCSKVEREKGKQASAAETIPTNLQGSILM